MSKKKLKQRFQSLPLKGINSAVSLLNCFKESVCTDAIMYEGWRKQLCYKVTIWEAVWEVKIRTEYKCMQHWCISMLFASQKVTSPPPAVLLSLWIFHFITGLSYYFHAVCSHEALQLAQDMATLTTGRLLSPVWPVYPDVRWQWHRIHYSKSIPPRRERERERKKASGMINSILNTLSPRSSLEKKSKEKERGRKKSKSIGFSLQLWFMSLFWLFFYWMRGQREIVFFSFWEWLIL